MTQQPSTGLQPPSPAAEPRPGNAGEGQKIQRSEYRTRRVQFCAVRGIQIAGQTFVPDAATAYVEFYLSHAFPVTLDNPKEPDNTAIHPQTVANSYQSLRGKVLNLAHLMKSYDRKKNPRDRILGTVMAVEFPDAPAGGWKVQGDPAQAPGIRAVAALHKNAEGVDMILDTWAEGKTPFGETEWTVSMENQSGVDEGGFLVLGSGVQDLGIFADKTPDDFKALGWVYVPYNDAPEGLLECLGEGEKLCIVKDYQEQKTLFLVGGLRGTIFYFGVALTPEAKETAAHVSQILASKTELIDVSPAFDAVKTFAESFTKQPSLHPGNVTCTTLHIGP